MKVIKQMCSIFLVTLVVLSLVGCTPGVEQKGNPVDGAGNSQVKNADLNDVDSSKTKINIGDYTEETARFYSTDITTTTDSAIASHISVSDVSYEDTAVLQAATAEERKFIVDTVPTLGLFMEVAEDTNDNGIQLHAEADENEILSYAYFLDGSVQMTYVKQWLATDSMADFADKLAKNIVDYVGLDVTGDDLKQVQNMIYNTASEGQYSFVITDEAAMNGFYMSVVGYGTDEASWQVYAQRYIVSAAAEVPEG